MNLLPKAPLFTIDRDADITPEIILKAIQDHQKYIGRYEALYNMYINHTNIFFQKEKAEYKPDVRLSVPFVKYIVDTFCGYFNGIPIKKSHESDDYLTAISQFDNANDMEDEESELLKMACIYGHTFEYMYQNEHTQTRTIYVSPKEMFIVYDKTIEQKPVYAVYYGVDDVANYKGTVVTLDEIKHFKTENHMIAFTDETINPYDKLPVVEWVLNDERLSLYEPIMSLINTYNKAISEKANDVEYFSDAYMKMLGAEIDEETLKSIKDNRIINMYGADAGKIVVDFMDKPDSDSQTEHLLDRLERLIYHTAMVANISDENFGNASGTSLAYKLQAMSNLALSVQRKFQSSLNRRYELFSSLRTNVPESMKNEWENLQYTFTRNEPKNILEEAQTASQLLGITSDETALSVLSIVGDVQQEINKIKAEKPLMDFEGRQDG